MENLWGVVFCVGLLSNAAWAVPTFPCDAAGGFNGFPFCNTGLSIGERVKDLIGRLTLQEKIGQLVNSAAYVPRLGIPKYEWWSEALHGVSNVGPGTRFSPLVPAATSFPTVILSAASFNVSLWLTLGQTVSTEARAMHNVGLAGLTYWSPNVNIFRDPRWGRGLETPGEDPFLTSTYAATYVKGLQQTGGPDPNRLKVAACCKHYTAYDLDNWNGVNRFTFNAKVSKYDLADTFNPPFYGCVKDGNVASVMCSYNQVNGVPSCADPNLLIGTVRGQWKLNGYIVSDCDSVDVLFNSQHYTQTPEDAVADVLKAGLDLDCGAFLGKYTKSAVEKGKVTESQVDGALTNTFTTLMRLGWFDGDPTKQPFGNLGPKDVCTPAHQELALDAARQGIVLLKNNGALPFANNKIRKLAVIGPNANATTAMIGNYAGIPCKYTSPLDGLSRYTATLFAPGCSNVLCGQKDMLVEAVRTAKRADATVIVVGGDLSLEAEGLDRTSLLLPGFQEELVTLIASAAKGPIILVVMSGGPFDISFAKNNDKIAGILWVGYPGQAGGAAIADVLFGVYNPGGRLPVTWYPQDFVKIPMSDMNMRPSPRRGYPGRTYRFYTGPTVYNFGDGLSYSTYKTTLVNAPKLVNVPLKKKNGCLDSRSNSTCQFIPVSLAKCEHIVADVNVDVWNKGPRDGTHTVLLYVRPPVALYYTPKKQLIAFRKIYLPARAKQRVHFKLEICKGLVIVDKHGRQTLPMGDHVLHIDDVQHSLSLAVDM